MNKLILTITLLLCTVDGWGQEWLFLIDKNGSYVRTKSEALYAEYISGVDTVTFQSVQSDPVDQVTFSFAAESGQSYTVDWGDGTDTTVTASGSLQTVTSEYTDTDTTFTVNLIGRSNKLTQFRCYNETTAKFNINEFESATALTSLYLNKVNEYSYGYFDDLSSTLTSIYIDTCGAEITYNKGALNKWANSNITVKTNMRQGLIDTLLVNYNTAHSTTSGTLNIGGWNIHPSDVGNTAIAALGGKGKTVVSADKSVVLYSNQPATINQVTFTFLIDSGDSITVNWGDGNMVNVVGTGANQNVTSNYTTNNTLYTITITGMLESVFGVTYDERTLFTNFNNYTQFHNATVFNFYASHNTNTHTGNIEFSPIKLTYLQCRIMGDGFRGNAAYLAKTLTTLIIRDNANIIIPLYDLSNILETLAIYGGTLIGDLGDIPNSIIALTLRECTGLENSVIDSLQHVSSTLTLHTIGTGNISGNFSSLSTDLTSITLYNIGTGVDITSGTFKAWTNASISIQSGYISASVDGFLNAWAPVAGTATKTINLAGSGAGIANQARTSASDAAVITLGTKGKSIITNP